MGDTNNLRRGRHSVHGSSVRGDWETPPDLFATLNAEFGFEVDVAASDSNKLCASYFTKETDALTASWGERRCWMNPPYGSEIKAWMRKAYEASLSGALVVCLVPARTDTAWWHDYAERASERRFIRGRVRFQMNGVVNGEGRAQKSAAPFPSAIVIFRPVARC